MALHPSCPLLQVRLDVQAKLGVPITTYNVVQGTKTPPGPGSVADYHIKVLILDSTWQIFVINFLCEKFCMFLWKNYHVKFIISALQVEVDEPTYKYVHIDVRSTAGAVELTKATPSQS